jgi:hypothetical protein
LLCIGLFESTAFAVTYYYELNTSCYRFPDNYDIDTDYTKSGTINWITPIQNGESAWNSTSAPILFMYSSSHIEVHIKSNAYGNTGWDGLCSPPYWTNLNTGSVKLNDTYSSNIGSNKAELVAHELGHILGLLDISPTYKTLMRSTGYNGSAAPTGSDIAGVKEKYN